MVDFKWIVQSENIMNNGVPLHDIFVTQQIKGNTLAVAALKGKTTKSDPPPVVADYAIFFPHLDHQFPNETTLSLSSW